MPKCICCNQEGKYSILLAIGPQANADDKSPRYYLPNQSARSKKVARLVGSPIEEVWFCPVCMRKVEDNLRATIQYLKSENKGE